LPAAKISEQGKLLRDLYHRACYHGFEELEGELVKWVLKRSKDLFFLLREI
jgi:two-component SAPR family response regulator